MNFLIHLDPGAPALVLAASSAAIVAAVALGAELLARSLARRGAASRHEVYLVALMIVLASPILAVAVGRSGLVLALLPAGPRVVEPPPAPPIETPSAPPAPTASFPADDIEPIASTPPPLPAVEPERPAPPEARPEPEAPRDLVAIARGGLVAAWAAVAVGLALRLICGLFAMAALRRRARPIDVAPIASVLDDVREATGTRRLPPILEATSGLVGPVTAGVVRPAVVLPIGLADRLGPEEWRDVLVHEVAHAIRRDGLVGLLQRVAATVFWPHPLVHRLNRLLSRSREEACDDFVLHRGDPRRFARTLLLLAESAGPNRRAAGVVGLFESRWRLEDRVARVLDPGRTSMTRANRWLTLPAAAVLASAAVTAAAVRSSPPDDPPKTDPEAKPAVAADPGPVSVLRGTVVDEAGRPVAGAVVDIPYGRGLGRPRAETGPEGQFTLRHDRPVVGIATALRARQGDRIGIVTYRASALETDPEPLRIELKPGRPLTVLVTDAAGKPVADAAVEVMHSFPPYLDDAARTDRQGVAHLRLPAGLPVRTVSALKDGVGLDYYENYRASPALEYGELPDEVALKLDGARTVTVRAIGSDGRSAPGVEISVWTTRKPGKIASVNLAGSQIASAVTDADGRVRFAWLPRENGANLVASAEELASPNILAVEPGGNASVTYPVVRMARISGRLVRPDGSPARGVRVVAGGRGKDARPTNVAALTDVDGRYTIKGAPNQSYSVAVSDPAWAVEPKTGLVVREGEARDGVDFRLIPGTRLRGRVAADPSGRPGTDIVRIDFLGPELPESLRPFAARRDREHVLLSAKAGADSRYEARLGPGEYEIHGPDGRSRETIRVDGTGEVVRDFPATIPKDVELAGVVVDPSGRPVAGADLRVFADGRGDPIRATTAAAGRFAFRRRALPSRLYARTPDGMLAGVMALPDAPGEIKLALARASAVSGRIVDDRGRPQAADGMNLHLIAGPGDPPVRVSMGYVRTDRDGRYRYDGIVPGGSYVATVIVNSGPRAGESIPIKTFLVEGPAPIDLGEFVVPAAKPEPAARGQAEAAEAKGPAQVADAAGTAVRGTVVDEAGKPVAGVMVDLITRDYRFAGPVRQESVRVGPVPTGPDGGFVLRHDRALRTLGVVRATADGGGRLGVASVRVGGSAQAGPIRVVLSASRPLTVRVADAAGKSVAGAAVEVATSEIATGSNVAAVDPGATDDGGVARFRVPADAPCEAVLAVKEGVGADYFMNRTPRPPQGALGPPPTEVSLTLKGPRTITLRALDSAGRPVPGVVCRLDGINLRGRASLRGASRITEVTTDAAGLARWRWVPEECSADVRLMPGEDLVEEAVPRLSFFSEGDVTLTVLLRRTARLSGRVTDIDGSPARGVTVMAKGPQTTSVVPSGAARTGEDGTYSIAVPPGRPYLLAVTSIGHAAKPISDLPIGEGEHHVGLDFRLVEGTRLHGRVAIPPGASRTIAVNILGEELPAEFQRSPGGKERLRLIMARSTLDAQGRYEIRLGPGDYEVMVPSYREHPTIHVDGAGEFLLDFLGDPIPPPILLNGVVVEVGPGGKERPVKASVNTRTGEPYFSSRATADEAGRFSARRPDQDVALYVSGEGKVAAVKVAKGADGVKVVLGPGVTASGRVVDPSRRPVVGEGPFLSMLGGPEGLPGITDAIHLSKLEADGRYEFKGLIPGAEYRARFTYVRDSGAHDTFTIKTFRTDGPGPIDLGEFVVPAAAEGK